MTRGEEAVRGFQPDGKEHPLAVRRLSGKFKTAFPDGRPAAKEPTARREAEARAGRRHRPGAEGSTGGNTVVLSADTDLLNDGAAVQIREIFGQRVAIPINGNLAFIQALVEQMAGDSDLINAAQPRHRFAPVHRRQADGGGGGAGVPRQDQVRSRTASQETRKKLEALQKTKGPPAGGSAILSPEQQAEVENFRKRAADTRRELKDVRRELRSETEALEFWTKVVNIGAMPLLVALAGHRDRDRGRRRRAHGRAANDEWKAIPARARRARGARGRRRWPAEVEARRAIRSPTPGSASGWSTASRSTRSRRSTSSSRKRHRHAGTRTEHGWTVKERGDYPADVEPIRDLLLKLEELKVVQAEGLSDAVKPRLQLAAPDGAREARGDRDAGRPEGRGTGSRSAKLVLGKKTIKEMKMPGLTGDGVPRGRYVWVASDPQRVNVVNEPFSDRRGEARAVACEASSCDSSGRSRSRPSGRTARRSGRCAKDKEDAEWKLAGPGTLDCRRRMTPRARSTRCRSRTPHPA